MISSSDMALLYGSSAALPQFLSCECASPRLFCFVDGPMCVRYWLCEWVRFPCPVLDGRFAPSVGACVLLSSLALTAWLGLVIVVVVVVVVVAVVVVVVVVAVVVVVVAVVVVVVVVAVVVVVVVVVAVVVV